jgi:hypothetical protein
MDPWTRQVPVTVNPMMNAELRGHGLPGSSGSFFSAGGSHGVWKIFIEIRKSDFTSNIIKFHQVLIGDGVNKLSPVIIYLYYLI